MQLILNKIPVNIGYMKRDTDLSSRDEPTVVALAMLGNHDAFEELVRRRQSWLRNLMRRLSGNRELADDLAQQVLLQTWRNIRGLRSNRAFGGWMKKLAVNTWLQHVRHNNPIDLADEWAGDIELDELTINETPGTGIDLDRALTTLPETVRLCIVLSYNEGMSHGAIAELTEIPLGTVKSHINRGTRQLKKLLVAYQNENN